jgi:hypothetical protein
MEIPVAETRRWSRFNITADANKQITELQNQNQIL